uniref:Nuclear RNA export factor 1-like n=1 Tax=Gouania willdenowi TaxID=441366 RepID=A0A8C5H039_GOUWI
MAFYNDDNDRIAPQRFRKHRGPYKGSSFRRDRQRGNHRGGFGGPGLWSRLVIDKDVTMSNSSQDSSSQQRHNPYGREFCKGDRRMDRDWRQGKGGGGRGGGRGSFRGGTRSRTGWFKITIPHGKKYDKKWLVPALQDICSIPYTPIQYHEDHNKVHFYVDDFTTASALRKCSRKVTDCDGYKQCMSKRFDGSQQALDLTSIHTDPDMVSQDVKMVLNRKTNMEAVIKIVEENIPQLTSLNLSHNCIQRLDELSELVTKVPHLKALNLSHNDLKSEHELDKLKGLKLVELWLVRNPLCDLFKDPSSYVNRVSKTPDNLIGVDMQSVFCLFHRYYTVYDSGDRQSLLGAYHNEALFSLTTPYNVQNPSMSGLREYFKDSRNLKRTKDSTMRFHLLKHKRLNVVALLNELPKTQHDITSFTVDVNAYTSTLLSFTVGGVFKEGQKSLTFEPCGPRSYLNSLCIINDQLFIRMATTEQISRAFVAPAPPPSSSPVPTLTAPQQEMLSTFSLKSGMNLEWSLKCLQDNEWDMNKAAHIFTQLKTAGKIPDVAFLK